LFFRENLVRGVRGSSQKTGLLSIRLEKRHPRRPSLIIDNRDSIGGVSVTAGVNGLTGREKTTVGVKDCGSGRGGVVGVRTSEFCTTTGL
jgi:hypothetical protein